ncbi:MAG: alpha-L-rhamnosidase N-terminal domain-containing protein [Cytophagales bacterium]|nr:alpha-L-rhamnosidase N-terminal domain-containing protein [Cytophagales bacterium]
MKRRKFIQNTSTALIGSYSLVTYSEALHKYTYENMPIDNEKSIKPFNAKFIWHNDEDKKRNIYADFRKSFKLNTIPKQNIFNIFADTSYQLFVNGNFISQGPIRFYPQYPVYDKYDLTKYLQTGENVIAVKVNYFGMKTYKSVLNQAGMICWGAVGNINLESNDKNWKVISAGEHGRYVQKYSFALNAAELYEQSKEQKGWKNINFDDSNWANATILKNQNTWGNFTERPIPFMSGANIELDTEVRMLPLLKTLNMYSFSVPIPLLFEDNSPYSRKTYIPFKTYVYSEKKQDIVVTTFWGEFWLNGEVLKTSKDFFREGQKLTQKWKLNEGWNYLFGKIGPYSDVLNHYFGIPIESNVYFSADKNKASGNIFQVGTLLHKNEFETKMLTRSLPFAENDALSDAGGWKWVTSNDKAQSPTIECGWEIFGQEFETETFTKIQNKKYTLSEYPEGFYLLIDLEYMHLAYPYISLTGVKDTVIDICYSEKLLGDKTRLQIQFNNPAGDRILCSEDTITWMPSHPRGIRYIGITVRQPKSDININFIKFISANYPVVKTGTFNSSDTLLNNIWAACERSQSANMEDTYVDCSGRERGNYLRDTVIQYHNTLAFYGVHDLFKRCLELYAQSPEESTGKFRAVVPNSGDYTISDFCLNGVEGFKAYYDHTGDIDFIKKHWSVIKNNLKWFCNLSDEREDKLLDAEWDTHKGINAHYGGFHGDLGVPRNYMSINGIHTAFTITYIIALQCAEGLAKALGNSADVLEYRQRIDFLSKSVNDKMWNPTLGIYADNITKDTHSIQANMFAIRAGIADKQKLDSIRDYFTKNFTSIFINGYNPDDGVYSSPPYLFYVLDGLYKAGLENIAEKIIKDGWGWCLMMGMKTTPEYFELFNSLCHAWSAHPGYYLSKYVLGVQFPKAPDLKYVEINVKTQNVQQAEGAFPHPQGGIIKVKWHMQGGKRVFDYVIVPQGVEYKIIT